MTDLELIMYSLYIAETSVKQSEERYKELIQKSSHPVFKGEFYSADCSKTRLKDLYKDQSQLLDITSCQFVFHYSFETLEQADMMMRNACECLKPGGYFIGTTPDARELIRRLKDAEDTSFGNSVYRVSFESKDEFPLFGCKYDFHLEGVVDCPEFLVHFGMLEKLAAKYGMIPVYKENFASLFEQRIKDKRNVDLLKRMSALEEYPAPRGKHLVTSEPEAYREAENKLKELHNAGTQAKQVLTISKDEWEAITLYLAFAFQKISSPLEEEEGAETSHD
ncbi:RNMT [Bugula neritina]|uniref:mRNA (guanine-N(7))-methyltransferase n=1 Tax=Bugula neritina TaxID=10212 RepID=A0A7J7K8E8_BUGNE|nr:RNMT [Bugula neritina]